MSTGNASENQELTGQQSPNGDSAGNSGDGQDLTEVVKGLSRTVTSLKAQLAQAAAAPKGEVQEELAELRRFRQDFELLDKYSDVAPVLRPLFKKKDFDRSVVDDEFVAAIRTAQQSSSTTGESEEPIVPLNPARKGTGITQEQKDEQTVRGMTSLFPD